MEKVAELIKPVQDAWIAEREAKGLPAQALISRAMQLIKEYSK
jgi:hypothetical protein